MLKTYWDKKYTTLTPLSKPEPEPAHWGWKTLGGALALVMLAWVGSWAVVGLAV